MTTLRPTVLPEALTARRKAADLSRQELADKLGISRTRIDQLERGYQAGVRPPMLNALATALGCDPSDISEVTQEEASA